MKKRLFVTLCLVSLLGACSFAPNYNRPEMDMPTEWRSIDTGTEPLSLTWWDRFQDPVLSAMIVEALANNQDIAEALAKVASAQAQLGVATTALLPTVTGSGEALSQSASTKSPNAPSYNSGPLNPSRSTTQYGAALGASWELDLWGKYRNQYTALSDFLLSTSVGYDGTRLMVSGQTAQGYFALRALDMQLATARRTLKTREDALQIYEVRYTRGDITELNYLQAKNEVEVARAQLHTTITGLDQAEAALAVLLGRSPRDIMNRAVERGTSVANTIVVPVLPEGLPSQLLIRRPDIRSAEYMIMAYNANIGAVRAEFFPSISLTAAFGSMSSSMTNLFSGPAATWSYGAQAAMPIIDFGRTWYRVKDAEAQKQASIAVYRKTVQTAFKDLRVALTQQREADAIVRSYQAQVDNMTRATQLARLQYDNGYTDYLTVLDSERQLFTAEIQLASALRDRLNAVVAVCMALGGGWEDPQAAPAKASTTNDNAATAQ